MQAEVQVQAVPEKVREIRVADHYDLMCSLKAISPYDKYYTTSLVLKIRDQLQVFDRFRLIDYYEQDQEESKFERACKEISELADAFKGFPNIKTISLYIRFPFINDASFHSLRVAIDALEPEVIMVVNDPINDKKWNEGNWIWPWMKLNNASRVIEYKEWDWN